MLSNRRVPNRAGSAREGRELVKVAFYKDGPNLRHSVERLDDRRRNGRPSVGAPDRLSRND